MADNRRGLELWGPAGRWLFLNWPRGSWQYDLVCGAIIVGLFVLPGPQGPAPRDLDGVLAAVSTADEEIDAYTARIVESRHSQLFDATDVERGKLSIREPGSMRRDIEEPGPRVEVLVGDTARLYQPNLEKVDVYTVGSRGAPLLQLPGLLYGRGAGALQESFDVSLERVIEAGTTVAAADGVPELHAEQRLYVLELVPGDETGVVGERFRSVEVWLEEGSWHPARRIVLTEDAGDRVTIDLAEVDTGVDLEDDDFELDLPDDVTIIHHDRIGTLSAR